MLACAYIIHQSRRGGIPRLFALINKHRDFNRDHFLVLRLSFTAAARQMRGFAECCRYLRAISDLKWHTETNIHRTGQRGVRNYRCPPIAPNWPGTCYSLLSRSLRLSLLSVHFFYVRPVSLDPYTGFLIIIFCIRISAINTRGHST